MTFNFNGFSASRTVFAPEGSILVIVVVLQPDQVIVEEMEVEGVLQCETGFVSISEGDFFIDGLGQDCIRVEGNCNLSIESDNVTLVNCERCADVRGTGSLQVSSLSTFLDDMLVGGEISCEGAEGFRARGDASVDLFSDSGIFILTDGDGIRSEGNADTVLDTTSDIEIDSGENGIRAEGVTSTSLIADGDIDVFGAENGIRAEGTPFVEVLAGGECVIEGGEFAIREDGVPNLNIDPDCVLLVE